MSAIFGILRFDDGEVARGDLGRMQAALAHHALDGAAHEAFGAVGLGTCRARVNREDRFELQPLHDARLDVTLVADARLDAREALAATLGIAGDALATTPDSALILAAYARWGADLGAYLLGDFAAAIWDGGTRRLLLLRDHAGQRPLFYHHAPGFLAFASEIAALWTLPDVPRVLPDAMIGRMLLHATDAGPGDAEEPSAPGGPGQTAYAGIASLPGGHALETTRDGAATLRRYWTPAADPAHLGRDEAYYVAAYRRVLGAAVADRVRRLDRPPGLQLSGGYDSSAIAGLAGPVLAERGLAMIAAASVMPAAYRGTIRHAGRWVDLCERDMPWLRIHRVTRAGLDVLHELDARLARGGGAGGGAGGGGAYGFVHDALYAALAAGGARLMMDGHGGDYTLNPRGAGALARFFKMRRWRRFWRELLAHRAMTGASWRTTIALDLLPHVAPWLLRSYWRGRGFWRGWRDWRGWRERQPAWATLPIRRAFAERLLADGTVDPARLRSAARDQTALRDRLAETLRRIVAQGSAGDGPARHGLVLTRPFHDKRVIELALAIPEDLYVRDGRNRYLACRALADVYPVEFQARSRRNDDEIPDFQAMVSRIMPALLADIARMEQSESLSGMIDFARIRQLLAVRGPDDHNSGWEEETQVALGGYLTARAVEAFRRANG